MLIVRNPSILEELLKKRGQAMLLKMALVNDFGYAYEVESDELSSPASREALSAQSSEEAKEILEDAQRRLAHADESAFHAEPEAFSDIRVQLPLFLLRKEYALLLRDAAWLAGRFGIQLSSDFGQSFARSMALTALRRGGQLDESGCIRPAE